MDNNMDSGVASDEEKRSQRTKEQKQRLNEQQQLFSGCFIDATSLGDEEVLLVGRRNDERRQGALVFQSSIQQYSTLHMPEMGGETDEPTVELQVDQYADDLATPHNSLVHLESEGEKPKSSVGFYVDLSLLSPEKPSTSSEKKNIFSMVIDFDGPKKEMPSKLSSSLYCRRSNGKSNGTSSGKNPQADAKETTVKRSRKVVDDGLETANKPQFVKLSDLEEQLPRVDLSLVPRMSRSIPEKSWVETSLMSRSAGYRTSPPRPLPPDPPPPGTPRSPTDDKSLSSQPKRSAQRLGTDLLRMFLEEIGPDVSLRVGKRRIHAHKCILSSRCQYFAAVFGGSWTETTTTTENVVAIEGYSYASVHFALCHIYSGASHIPDTISLVELASLADMLCLEGLKEVVAQALKIRHCHNFHAACPGCITGVVEVLPLGAAYGLDELYRTCLEWIAEHFVRVWPTRGFAGLEKELRDKCYRQHVVHMTAETAMRTMNECESLLATMPTSKWAEPVAQITSKLADHCQLYAKQHFVAILGSKSFLALDEDPKSIASFEDRFVSASGSLSPDQAVRGYVKVKKLLSDRTFGPQFASLLHKISLNVVHCLTRQMTQVLHCKSWKAVDANTKKQIRELGTPTRIKCTSSDSSRNSSPTGTPTVRNRSPNLRRNLLLAAKTNRGSLPPSTVSPTTVRRTSTLTKPTKSSAAKAAIKSRLPPPPPPPPTKTKRPEKSKLPLGKSTIRSGKGSVPPPPQPPPPAMQRSGTFLKEEPTVMGKMK